MGGARTLEWTLLYPEAVDYALVLAVSARASAWQIGIQSAQITSITQDPDWHGGDYHGTGCAPDAGLAAARRIAHLTYRGELEIDERFGTSAQAGENPLGPFRADGQRFAVQSYLEHQGTKLTQRFDAASYVTLTEALNRHDVGRDRGGLNKALASSTVPTMIVGVDTDILYPYHQQEHLSRNLGNLLAMAKLSSPVGHDAFLVEARQMDRILRNFISLTHETPSAREVAAERGARQVFFAVVATTIVLLSVFAPLLFLPGYVGRLFVELAAAIAARVPLRPRVRLLEYGAGTAKASLPQVEELAERLHITSMTGSEMLRSEELAEEIRRRVAEITEKLPHQEQIRDLRVLWDEFTTDNGLLTPTLKVRRREVEKRFTEIVEEMYARLAARRRAGKKNSRH